MRGRLFFTGRRVAGIRYRSSESESELTSSFEGDLLGWDDEEEELEEASESSAGVGWAKNRASCPARTLSAIESW